MSARVPDSLICLGLGYSALFLVERLLAAGQTQVAGTVRSQAKASALAAAGIDVYLWQGEIPSPSRPPSPSQSPSQSPAPIPVLPRTERSVFLISTPPDADGCPAARAFGHLAGGRPVIYLSTTGVYGDRAGAWIDETSAPTPTSARGERRLLAEQQWRAVTEHLAIVRLPGIYGPGRSVLERLKAQQARRIVKSGLVFSRIHVADLAAGLHAILDAGVPRGVYHFTDNEPAPPEAPIIFGAECLGIAPPPREPFDHASMSPMALSFYSECKRVSSQHTRDRLGWVPRYPTYREGLMAILDGGDPQPFGMGQCFE